MARTNKKRAVEAEMDAKRKVGAGLCWYTSGGGGGGVKPIFQAYRPGWRCGGVVGALVRLFCGGAVDRRVRWQLALLFHVSGPPNSFAKRLAACY